MRSKFLIYAAALAIVTGTHAFAQQSPHWTMVWSDEFNGPANSLPDETKWKYDTGDGGWGNHELETYCAPGSNVSPCSTASPNVYLDGTGHLIIRAIRSTAGWTSARLLTQGKEELLYGRVEARMKLPTGAGVWPAFWLLGSDIGTTGWPTPGEIDVMEQVPKLGPHTIAAHIHGPISRGEGIGTSFTVPGSDGAEGAFHTYGLLWSPDRISFYVDDPEHPFHTVQKSRAPPDDWVFNHPFFMLLNLAIGGDWPGPPNDLTPNPVKMEVDYVRVYQPGH